MAIDLQADARRLPRAVLVGAGALLLVLGAAGVQALTPQWKSHQREFRAHGGGGDGPGVVQSSTCVEGEVDRCATCHLGADRPDLAEAKLPLKAHSMPLGAHTARGVGCSDCHGGSPRALRAEAAHAFPGTAGRDAMMRQPHIQASCGRCHVPGDAPGMERLARGAKQYTELGCGICHPLTGGGLGGYDFGPDLRGGARKSLEYLEQSLTDPAINFPESTMPGFSSVAAEDPEGFTDLVIFLESLQLARAGGRCSTREKSDRLLGLACATCHSGPGGRAAERYRHRCPYLLERAEQLRCARCHPDGVPATDAAPAEAAAPEECPVVREHRGNCASCHEPAAAAGGAR